MADVATKLQIRPGTAVWISDPEFVGVIGPMPAGVELADAPATAAVALVVGTDAATVRAVLGRDAEGIAAVPVVWVAYAKGGASDINRDTLWPIVGEFGMRPNGLVAIDPTWSALRFRALRPGEAPFSRP